MLKYGLFVIFICFVAENLSAEYSTESPLENTTDDIYAGLIFPNFSIEALDGPNYRAFPRQVIPKKFVVVAYAKANWFKAQQFCGYQGLALASITSYEEDQVLQKFLYNNNLSFNSEEYWLSGSKHADGREWIWFNSGRPVAFSRWALGRPLGVLGSRKCLAMMANGQWTNDRCEKEKYFICETRCPLNSYDLPIYEEVKEDKYL
ncbi:C-type lectin lectoxin-Lio2 [Ceratitis capitata]|uniref:(Mediterranean fruit fly) hypothetical protein n=2 Tax=Ceratitis capitata TaxID=7213 RepID=A0A811V8Q3_CERCA|nr:C-type lectin lectoxin-Lio2 [Ceratitis capitata]CAD7011710.1 unnamed protein product [Ceratitis capitata]